MKHLVRIICVLVIVVSTISGRSQDQDSLKRALLVCKNDTTAIKILIYLSEIGDEKDAFRYADSARLLSEQGIKQNKSPYYNRFYRSNLGAALNNIGFGYNLTGDYYKAISYYEKSLEQLRIVNDTIGMAYCLSNVGFAYQYLGKINEALLFYEKALLLRIAVNDQEGLWQSYNNIASIYDDRGDVVKALQNYELSLKTVKEIKDKAGEANALNNIGYVYYNQRENKKALEYFLASVKIQEETKDKRRLAFSYTHIGNVYKAEKDYQSTIDFYEKALKLRVELDDKKGMANSYNLFGFMFMQMGDTIKAYENFNKAIDLLKVVDDKKEKARTLYNFGRLKFYNGKLKEAKVDALESYDLSMELGYPMDIKESAKLLYDIYNKEGNYEGALKMFRQYVIMRDSLNSIESTKAALKLQMKNQYEHKVAQDSLRIAEERKLNAARFEKEQTKRYALYGGLILVLLFAALMYNRVKVTLQQKKLIEVQKHLVEEKQKEVLDSISYAKRLQDAILPPQELVNKYLPDNFILYKPKDIVAGDFYWFEHIEGASYMAAADSTGHGVPGALVSVVCSNALNRAVNEFGLRVPGEILNKTRELVLETFARSDKDVKDGMDISLIKITEQVQKGMPGRLVIPKGQSLHDVLDNQRKFKVEWAGANNPLWYQQNNTIHEVVAHKQPIGKTEKPTPFPTHTLELHKGDMFYLFTDGYADQFGGPKGKKFKYKQLEDLLLENSGATVSQQKEILDLTFNLWKGDLEQIDDVCIIGVRV